MGNEGRIWEIPQQILGYRKFPAGNAGRCRSRRRGAVGRVRPPVSRRRSAADGAPPPAGPPVRRSAADRSAGRTGSRDGAGPGQCRTHRAELGPDSAGHTGQSWARTVPDTPARAGSGQCRTHRRELGPDSAGHTGQSWVRTVYSSRIESQSPRRALSIPLGDTAARSPRRPDQHGAGVEQQRLCL